MSFLSDFAKAVAKPFAWVAGRLAGQDAANMVDKFVEDGVTKEIKTAVPILVADIEKITPALAAIADASIDYVRDKFTALVSNVNVSATAAGRLTAAITAVAAPDATKVVNNIILTFASDVTAALQSL